MVDPVWVGDAVFGSGSLCGRGGKLYFDVSGDRWSTWGTERVGLYDDGSSPRALVDHAR
jgi:hypothetical protein